MSAAMPSAGSLEGKPPPLLKARTGGMPASLDFFFRCESLSGICYSSYASMSIGLPCYMHMYVYVGELRPGVYVL